MICFPTLFLVLVSQVKQLSNSKYQDLTPSSDLADKTSHVTLDKVTSACASLTIKQEVLASSSKCLALLFAFYKS